MLQLRSQEPATLAQPQKREHLEWVLYDDVCEVGSKDAPLRSARKLHCTDAPDRAGACNRPSNDASPCIDRMCPSESHFEAVYGKDTHTTGATRAVVAKPAASPKMAGVRPGEWMASKTMDYHCCSPFTQNDVWLEAVSLTWLGAGDVLAGSRCSFSDCSCSHSIA